MGDCEGPKSAGGGLGGGIDDGKPRFGSWGGKRSAVGDAGGGGGAEQGEVTGSLGRPRSDHPANAKFRPVEQHDMIAKRTSKVETLLNSAMSTRRFCKLSSAVGFAGLSSPMP